jgi:putative DNA primase/helicase
MSRDTVRAIVAEAPEITPEAPVQELPTTNDEPARDDAEIKRLAGLEALQYARERKAAAKALGIGVSVLDSAVKVERAQNIMATGQGRPVKLHHVEPWSYPVNGLLLLTELSVTLRKYVVMSDEQADAVSLWIVHAHAHDACDVSPKLVIRSVQKRCGKTRLVSAIARMTPRPLFVSGIRPAALLRIIETQCPTLLLDEIDAAMHQDREMAEALRGIINSGFDRVGARYIMNVPIAGGGYEPHEFSTWAPQLLAGIGHLPETVRDRAIEIEMSRKRRDQTVNRLRRRDGADLDELGRKATRWVRDNLETLRSANPQIPNGLDDRAADAWEPLFAIAEVAGEEWQQRAYKAALALSGDHVKEDEEIGTQLLADIRDVFAGKGSDVFVTKDGDKQIASEKLVATLVMREERPWAEFGRERKPLTKNRLASLLRGFKIRPGTIRIGPGESDTAKGYKLAQFIAAFEIYLSAPTPPQTVTSSQINNINSLRPVPTVTPSEDVTDGNAEKTSVFNDCDGVTVCTAELWETEL